MKKTAVILALALGLSMGNVYAFNNSLTTKVLTVNTIAISPICKAAATGDIDTVKKLINNGVSVNTKSNGMLPIHYAAKYNRVAIIKVLITAGSKVHATCDKGYTALNHAEKTNAKEAALFLKRFK